MDSPPVRNKPNATTATVRQFHAADTKKPLFFILQFMTAVIPNEAMMSPVKPIKSYKKSICLLSAAFGFEGETVNLLPLPPALFKPYSRTFLQSLY